MPTDRRMTTVDEQVVRAPLPVIFTLAADVERWPSHLSHYRYVRFHERTSDGGGLVEMSANRPFGAANWPTVWTSLMSVTAPGSASWTSSGLSSLCPVERWYESSMCGTVHRGR
jgi:hypothetical protein